MNEDERPNAFYDKFTFHIKPKLSMGQRGAGSDGVVEAGAYVTLSFPVAGVHARPAEPEVDARAS